MYEMKLVVRDFSEFNEDSPVWSNIFTEIAGLAFPSSEWYDATSAILEMWAHNLDALIQRDVERVELYYMDGDYSILLTTETTMLVRARCVNPDGETAVEECIDLLSFSGQVLHACEQLLDKYKQFYYSREIQALTYASSRLGNSIQRVVNSHPK